MGSGASAPGYLRGLSNDPAGLMALIDAERREKQWLANQYDLKCAEAVELRSQLEALQMAAEPPRGHAPSPVSNASSPAKSGCSVVYEGRESPSLSSPVSSPCSRGALRERRGLQISLDTKPGVPTSKATGSEQVAQVAQPARRLSTGCLKVSPEVAGRTQARHRNSVLGSEADVQFLGQLNTQVAKQYPVEVPPSPKRLLSQKTWA